MSRWKLAMARAAIALLLAFLAVLLPLPWPQQPVAVLIKNGVVTVLLVCYLGKLLYDTLF